MKRQQKKYERPLRPWDRPRIEAEKKIKQDYGLRRKKEIWKAQAILRNFRRLARELRAKKDKEKENILIEKVRKLGLIHANANLDDVLALNVQNILDRRLQTIVYKKGLANTPRQARQFIVHGHISLNGKRARFPSTLIVRDSEEKINFHEKSKVKQSKMSGENETAKA